MDTISLIGRTNSGKSMLLNSLIGKKIAAVGDKVNTTQTPLTGIYHHQDKSWLILDAPGVCRIKTNLDRLIFYNIHKVLELGQLVWWMIGIHDQWRKDNQILAQLLKKEQKPVFLLVNMIDLVSKEKVFKKILELKDKFPFAEVIPISAKKKTNFTHLIEITQRYFVASTPAPFAKNLFTFNSFSQLVQEIIREQIVRQTSDEIPHQTTLLLDQEKSNLSKREFYFHLIVATNSQKGIILGKGGSQIREIRLVSQQVLKKVTGKTISLFLTVKVHKNWYQDLHFLKKLRIDWKDYDYFSR